MTQTQPDSRLLRLREVAALLRLPLRTVLLAAALGQLPLVRAGLVVLVDEAVLRDQFTTTPG